LYDKDCEYYLGFEVLETQVRVEDEIAKGVIDVVAKRGDELALIDIKLTRDFYSVAAPYGYGYMDSMDMIQMALYKYLYDEAHGTNVSTYILVGDFSTQYRRKLVEVDVSQKMLDEVFSRLSTGYEVIDLYQKHGWTYDPSKRECDDCPLKCSNRYEKEVFDNETIHV
jgi:hypothetical protein